MSTETATYWSVRVRAIRKVARDAAALIRARGWKRGRCGKAGPIGVWEALWASDPKKPKDHPAYDVMPNVIARLESMICATTKMRHLHGGKKLVPRWNDTPGRTTDEVLALLDMMASGQDERIPFTYRDSTGRLSC